jgi:hypothetical protein
MSTMWFGKKYPARAYADCPQTETPVGEPCVHCDERIEAGDDGWFYANGPVAHRECYLRGVIGSVAHQERRCSCFGGSARDEEEGMTRRQGAKAAVEYFETHGIRHQN